MQEKWAPSREMPSQTKANQNEQSQSISQLKGNYKNSRNRKSHLHVKFQLDGNSHETPDEKGHSEVKFRNIRQNFECLPRTSNFGRSKEKQPQQVVSHHRLPYMHQEISKWSPAAENRPVARVKVIHPKLAQACEFSHNETILRQKQTKEGPSYEISKQFKLNGQVKPIWEPRDNMGQHATLNRGIQPKLAPTCEMPPQIIRQGRLILPDKGGSNGMVPSANIQQYRAPSNEMPAHPGQYRYIQGENSEDAIPNQEGLSPDRLQKVLDREQQEELNTLH